MSNNSGYYGEDINWRDEGCELFSSCLSCPLPYCIEEVPRGKQRLRMLDRAGRLAEIKYKGKSTAEIARIFGVSGRTVQRALVIARGAPEEEIKFNHLIAHSAR